MYFDDGEGMVFRPPSEANSFILRVTIGCSHNQCTFCSMYRDVRFRIRTVEEIDKQIQQAALAFPHLRRTFLADGNALVLSTSRLLDILGKLNETFPKLQRVSCYGGPKDILNKSVEELRALRDAGLQIIYLGMESGDDEVLNLLRKGVASKQMIEAGQKVIEAGIKLSMMVVLGAGGQGLSAQHAAHTAKAVNEIRPNMLSALTLMLHPGSELCQAADNGNFLPLSSQGQLQELRAIVDGIELPIEEHCLFRSNHVSNSLPLAGTLPKDKAQLLAKLDRVLATNPGGTEPNYNAKGSF
jgi:radical SAM superfamily enzyme YgiQ (UPF0313 family)